MRGGEGWVDRVLVLLLVVGVDAHPTMKMVRVRRQAVTTLQTPAAPASRAPARHRPPSPRGVARGGVLQHCGKGLEAEQLGKM